MLSLAQWMKSKGRMLSCILCGSQNHQVCIILGFSVFHLSLPPVRAISRWGKNWIEVQYEVITLSFWCHLPYLKKKKKTSSEKYSEKVEEKKVTLQSENADFNRNMTVPIVISYPRNIKTATPSPQQKRQPNSCKVCCENEWLFKKMFAFS